jgi:hypothetical protein
MTVLSAIRQGVAFAATTGLLYLACAIVALMSPGAIPGALDVVVHGLEIGSLTRDVPPTTVGEVGAGLLYVVAYSFVAGTVYGAIRNALAPRPTEG